MVSSVMTQSSSSNCSEDVDRFLLSLRGSKDTTPVTTPLPVTTQPQHPPSDTIAMCMLMLQDASFSLQENNALTYIAGYIMRKLQDKVSLLFANLHWVHHAQTAGQGVWGMQRQAGGNN